MQRRIVALFLVIHLILSAVLYLLMRWKRFKVRPIIMPLVVMVPIFGPICTLLIHLEGMSYKEHQPLELEKMQLNEEMYKSIFVGEMGETDRVVPLDEALLMDDAKERRRLIMDILEDGPAQYVELLDRAKLNDDPEVTHHATTALVELVKEYDLRLQKLEQAYSRAPESRNVLEAYCEFLHEYIGTGLIKGQMGRMQRQQYAQLLLKLMNQPGEPVLRHYQEYIQNAMSLQDFNEVQRMLGQMLDRWPDREEPWMLRLQFSVLLRHGEALKDTLKQIRERGIYLSSPNRAIVEFWEESGESR